MAYTHDIFISYGRDEEVRQWLIDHFVPLLKTNLRFELGREPNVFFDEQIKAGQIWPLRLAEAISKSRILIPLWTRTFLSSEWCALELSHMLARSRFKGESPYSLIVPVTIHDGETIPSDLSIIQKIEINKIFTVRMHRDSSSSEKLSQVLYSKASDIASVINKVPDWRNDWKIEAENVFFQLYYKQQNSSQRDLPTYTD